MPAEVVDKTMQVGVLRLPVHEEPNVGSKILAWLDQGAAVQVSAWSRFVRVPSTSSMTELGEREFVPTWAEVDCGNGIHGFVGARSLVDPRVYASMDEAAAEELAERSGDDAGQGFSEPRRKRLVAVKGAAGAFEQEGSDYGAADALLESAVAPIVGWATDWAGERLARMNPALASALESEAASRSSRSKDSQGGLGGLAGVGGMFGLDSDEAKLAAAVTEILGELLAEAEPTPIDEYMLARECMAAVLASSPLVPADDPRAIRLSEMGSSLAAASSLPYPLLGYHFILQDDDDTINAFASPGGAIFFTTGMLDFLGSDDELAAILAHEISHVEERHGVKLAMEHGYDKMPAFRRIFTLFVEGNLEDLIDGMVEDVDLPAELKDRARDEIRTLVIKQAREGYEELVSSVIEGVQQGESQAAETAADLRGMSLAAASGYSPEALGAVLDRLQANTGDYGGANYSEDRRGEASEVSPFFNETAVAMAGKVEAIRIPGVGAERAYPAGGSVNQELVDTDPGLAEEDAAETDPESGTVPSNGELDSDHQPEPDRGMAAEVHPGDNDEAGVESRATPNLEPEVEDDFEGSQANANEDGGSFSPSDVSADELPSRAPLEEEPMERMAVRVLFEAEEDLDRAGGRLLATMTEAEAVSASSVALAAAATRRLRELAEDERLPSGVRLLRIDLPRDGAAVIPQTSGSGEILIARSRGGFAALLGADVATDWNWDDVRRGNMRSEKPVVVWDRLRRPGGWQGWVIVIDQ